MQKILINMKKILLVLVTVLLLVSCKSKSVTETKLDRTSQVAIKGDWTISSVTFPGSDYMKVTSFDLADSKCFVGSVWHFISNNNKGNMALNSSSCTGYSSDITWYVNNEGNFVLKYLNGTKSKKMLDGYILRLANQTETSFQLVDKVNIGGKMVDVTYQFQKN